MVLSLTEVYVVAGGVTQVDLQVGIEGPVFSDVCLEPCE